MMKLFFRASTFLFVLFFLTVTLYAQDVFLSISGQKASNLSGDTRHQHDYWLRPSKSAGSAILRVFDAGVSWGTADVVYGTVETQTTFAVYPVSAIYDVFGDSLSEKMRVYGNPNYSLTAQDEPVFRERWATIGELNPVGSPNGYILRVTTNDGNDVNAFKIMVAKSGNINTPSEDWVVVASDLTLGLYNFPPNLEVQLQPLRASEAPPEFDFLGEEAAILRLKDDFGHATNLTNLGDFWQPARAATENHWGLSISRIGQNNHFSVFGKEKKVFWILKPNIVKTPELPKVQVRQVPGSDCGSVRLTLIGYQRNVETVREPVWVFENEKIVGDSAEIYFGKPDDYMAEVWIPNEGMYFPKYWIHPFQVHINAPPKAVISYDVLSAAPGQQTSFSARNSSDAEDRNLSYRWFVEGTLRGKESVFNFSSKTPGKYSIILTVTDNATNSFCTSASDSVILTVNSQPYTEIRFPEEFARKETVVFVAEKDSDPDADKLSYKWQGSGVQSDDEERAVEIRHERHGVYSVSQTVDDNHGLANSKYTKTVSYRVNAEPEPRFSLPEQAAPNDVLKLSAASTTDADDKELDFAWQSSDWQSFKGRDIDISFLNPGDYKVTLTVDDGHNVSNSVQILTKNIHINAPPFPMITAQNSSTIARQVFSAKYSSDSDSEDLRYFWDFGDGEKDRGLEVVHTFQKSGIYTITLTVDDQEKQTNSVQKTTHRFRLHRYPVAKFDLPKYAEPKHAFAVDASASYAPDGNIRQYKWFVDNRFAATGKTANLQISTPGDHIVSLLVTDDSGFEDAKSLATEKIHVNFEPLPRWEVSLPVAAPEQWIAFDAGDSYDLDGRIQNYTWTFSDGAVESGRKVTRKFSESGKVDFTLTVDDGTGFENAVQNTTGSVLINSTPIIVAPKTIRSNSRRVKLDASESYDVDRQALNFEWILPDGSKRHEAAFYWDAPKTGGVYFVSLNVDDGKNLKNSRASHTVKVLVNRPPVAVTDTLVRACTGQTILFNGSRSFDPDGDALKVSWDFGDGTTSGETDPAHVYRKPGEYSVVIKLDDGFAPEPTLAVIPVIIGSSPLAIQSFADTTVCVQTMLDFDGSQSEYPSGIIGSYAWDFGDGETALGKTVQHAFSKPGTYKVILTVVSAEGSFTTTGCSKIGQSSSTVRVIAGPVADFNAKNWVAIGDTVYLDASPSTTTTRILSADWRILADKEGKGDSATAKLGTRVLHVFQKPGLYPVILTIRDDNQASCNTSSTVKNIRVNAAPELSWRVPKAVALGEQVLLDAARSLDPDGLITHYNWTLDDQMIGETPAVIKSFSEAGEHELKLTITDNSPTRTKSVSAKSSIFVNTSPKPTFVLPEKIYEYELLELQAKPEVDADGDRLSFSWQVDGSPYGYDETRFTGGRHTLQLVADDRRGLSNSKDSIFTEIHVIPSPELEADFPEHIVVGQTLSSERDWKRESIGFVVDGQLQPTYTLAQTGRVAVKLGWAPKGIILKDSFRYLTVWEPLRFTETPAPMVLVWNPANPTVILSVPGVNRPASKMPLFRWKRGAMVLGYGETQEVPLYKGTNTFTVEAYEPDVAGSKTVSVEIVVKTQ
ncbi:PKD domain containing protein [Chloroherpeton thalassium ATCC 35110]|uniref:PKD domain containing protein n=1 Tax=Chloroherpeton thalassium (strain ATCC 35110 / GB-78) TaxID=517418 RepID=B3QS47_CHLT3|nr:PKD domain-containing protein [Chloroherpeton thalassium]ACF13992.1 PKD domain containing protein [Chloroherpeton thalassium ATCC 35110]